MDFSPLDRKKEIVAASGDRPLALSPYSFLVFESQTIANRSPPSPHDIGSTTPSTAFAAIRAAIALPPRWRTAIAAAVASGWLVAAIPCRARTAERDL